MKLKQLTPPPRWRGKMANRRYPAALEMTPTDLAPPSR
uniref:Uncharacterized protein n=1 Tax=Arundo donax TaxID=35708 RepID=A0A0A9FE59_ARUDO